MADHIYKDQPWSPYLDTENDLTSATLKIKAISPAGVETLLDATESATEGEIYAKITGAVNDESGMWKVLPWVLFSGDTAYSPGKPHQQLVENV